MRIRLSKWLLAVVLVVFSLLAFAPATSRKYVLLYPSGLASVGPPVEGQKTLSSPQLLLAEANRLSWLFNWPKAEPLYARAEKLFKESGDTRDEIYARVGRIRAQSETMSYVDVSEMIGKELDDPVVKTDPNLRLWCLAQKGYTDIEISPTVTKWDWTQARNIAKTLGETQWVARANAELGIVAFLQGESGRAAKLVGDALLSAMASGDTGGQVRSLEMLGNGFNTVQRHAEALAFFDRAIKVATKTPDAGFPYMAFEGKAQALVGQNKLRDARDTLNQALTIAKKNDKFGHQSQIFIQLGELDLQTGDREEATSYLREAGQLGWTHAFYRMATQAFFDLTNIYSTDGDEKSAERYASLGLDASRRVGDRYFLPRDLTVLADLKAREGHVAQANALYQQAEDVIDGMLVNADETYWSSSLAAAMSETYLHHFELVARTGNLARALDILERVRGRTAAALLEDRVTFSSDETPAVQALAATVSKLQLRLMRSDSATERRDLNNQLIEYERRLDWTRNDQDASRHEWLERPASLKSIQAVLHPNELALEYVLDEPHAFCIWISKKHSGLTALPAGKQAIRALTQTYLSSIRAKQDNVRVAEELYSVLLQPVTQAATHRTLIVVPDGILYFLPFDTLRQPDGSFLAESRTISYVPAMTVLDVLRTRSDQDKPQHSFLGVGDVPYQDQGDVSPELPKPEGIEKTVLRGLSDTLGTSLHDLPQTRAEVLDANKILGNDGVILLGSYATEATFESEPLADFRIVHLAVHGFADSRFPERSGLVLGIDRAPRDNGLLQIPEIMRLHFDADLVTLSACDTGVGKVEGEEGITNLAEAFLVSGAKAVVASLWRADDTFTSDLMKRFYTHLAQGEDKATALRDAKRDLLAKYGTHVSPYYWGAFVLIGDGGSPIPLH
ncbi:MAG TPA: CHAT domain-containing tetratricopeptide repeat protein [Candidatus Acidoferrales bacterium]|nr:CHAT domain-containing tetratricopeptide repeat protein [Candidatus Acidoferrales bacterium]